MDSSSIPDCVDKWVNNIHEQNVHHEKEGIANSVKVRKTTRRGG